MEINIFRKLAKKRLSIKLELYKLDLYRAEIEKQKEGLSRELELYRNEQYLNAEKNIFERMKNNWANLDEVRLKSYQERGEINAEIAVLKGYRDCWEIHGKSEMEKHYKDLLNVKNEEIISLKKVIEDLTGMMKYKKEA